MTFKLININSNTNCFNDTVIYQILNEQVLCNFFSSNYINKTRYISKTK